MIESFVDEPVLVQVRFGLSGSVQPTAFVWHSRTRYLAGLGRHWSERVGTVEWRCFLAQTASGDTVELRWNQQTHEWRLFRAWWRETLA
jgi:hypothetical protein